MSKLPQCVAGIDVSKTSLDVCVLGPGTPWSTTTADPVALADALRRRRVALAVVEPTGGYERPVLEALRAAGVPAALVNARQVREFARASGQLAKTDHMNYLSLGNMVRHVHWHIYPRYRDDPNWGAAPIPEPAVERLSDGEYRSLAAAIRAELPAR